MPIGKPSITVSNTEDPPYMKEIRRLKSVESKLRKRVERHRVREAVIKTLFREKIEALLRQIRVETDAGLVYDQTWPSRVSFEIFGEVCRETNQSSPEL